MKNISALIVAHNEEKNLPRCLASLSDIDELVLILDKTTDNSKNISKKYNSKIHERSCFQLMSIISMLDHDLAIGCKSLLPDDLRAILKNNGIQLIAMPEDEFFKSSININYQPSGETQNIIFSSTRHTS